MNFSKSLMKITKKGNLTKIIELYNESKINEDDCIKIMDFAVESGHIHIVKWIHKHVKNCYESDTMDGAALGGHLDIIKWLHNNAPQCCTKWAMDFAAEENHLEIVKWLHNNRQEGCTISAITESAERGLFQMVVWLYNNRPECGSSASLYLDLTYSSLYRNLEIIKFIYRYYPTMRQRIRNIAYRFGKNTIHILENEPEEQYQALLDSTNLPSDIIRYIIIPMLNGIIPNV